MCLKRRGLTDTVHDRIAKRFGVKRFRRSNTLHKQDDKKEQCGGDNTAGIMHIQYGIIK